MYVCTREESVRESGCVTTWGPTFHILGINISANISRKWLRYTITRICGAPGGGGGLRLYLPGCVHEILGVLGIFTVSYRISKESTLCIR
jgi:hypothetical protein